MLGVMFLEEVGKTFYVLMLVGVMIKMGEESWYFNQLFGEGVVAYKL